MVDAPARTRYDRRTCRASAVRVSHAPDSMLALEGWLTLGVIAVMFVSLVREWTSADVSVFGALCALWAMGIVDTEAALAGFSSPMVLTVGLLFVVSRAMQDTGALAWVSRRMLRPEADGQKLMARLLIPIATMSAFLNNTPLVAMFTPAVRDWALRNERSPSKYLIPLSYAAILGGTCTLIGTSTNLVVSGLLSENGYAPFGMFELAPVGLPATVVGLAFVMTVGRALLPERITPDAQLAGDAREYGVRLVVRPDCPLIGQTIEDAGLRHLSGLYLAEIIRGVDRIVPVRPTDRIAAGDVLVLFGVADTVVELRKIRGLSPLGEEDRAEHHDGLRDRQLFEVVVSANSPLTGSTLRDAGFRRRYDAAVIAIHRGGERLNVKLGDVELRSGDTLMLEASPGFGQAWGNSTDFYLVSQVEAAERPRYALANVSLIVLVVMVALVTARVLPMVLAAALAAMVLIALRCIRPSAARKAIDLRVLIVIASSFGLSAAVVESGLAARTSELLLGLVGDQHPLVSIAALYLATAILTEVVSNVAAAALVMPVAIAVAQQVALANGMDVDPRPWAIAVAMAASMSFITPLGYQTNLMVYGPGGYRFGDFARVGVPLALVCFVTAMAAISALVLPAL